MAGRNWARTGSLLLIGGAVVYFGVFGAYRAHRQAEVREWNERKAVGSLHVLVTSQSLFKDGDKDGDGVLDYGTLAELGRSGVIDRILATGRKQGYEFEVRHSLDAKTHTARFVATARPAVPGYSGTRWFAVDEGGTVYSRAEPFDVSDGLSLQIESASLAAAPW